LHGNKKAKQEARKAPGKLAGPPHAYWLWLDESREAIQQELRTKAFGVVGKSAGEKWKALLASTKPAYEKLAADKKDDYETAMAEWTEPEGNKENAGNNDDE